MKTKLLVLAIFVMAFFIAGCDYASRGHYNNSVPNKAFVLDVLEADFITKADTIVHDNTEYVWSTGQKGHVIEVSEPGEYIVDVKVETEKVSPYCRLITVINAKRVFTITADTLNCVGNTIILDATVPVDYHSKVEYSDYNWSTGQKGHAITVSEPGEYIVDGFQKISMYGLYETSSSTIITKGVFTVR
jgi:hypothetical protein